MCVDELVDVLRKGGWLVSSVEVKWMVVLMSWLMY